MSSPEKNALKGFAAAMEKASRYPPALSTKKTSIDATYQGSIGGGVDQY
jgi:hypothetical protein